MLNTIKNFVFVFVLIFASCQNANDTARLDTIASVYQNFEEKKGSSSLIIPDSASVAFAISFYETQLSGLDALNAEKLDTSGQKKYQKLKETLSNELWLLQELKVHEWKLSDYNYYNELAEMVWTKPELLKASSSYYERVKAITVNTIPVEADSFVTSHIKIYDDLKNRKEGKEGEMAQLIDENLILIKDVIAYAVSLRNNTTPQEVEEIQGRLVKIEIEE